nr:methyltransferase domain-containing protein [Candidatus Njordarchaeota archaeon]
MCSSFENIVKSYYDKKAPTYDDFSRQLYFVVYDAVTWKITEPYIPKDPDAIILDAGGGTGKWSIPIAKCGPRVILGDVSEGMLKVARKKVVQEGLQDRVEVKKCDLRELDFDDETFDLVFCDHVLCFIKEQETVIKELARVLKKDRPLIISGQNRYVLSLSLVPEDIYYASRVLSKESEFIMGDRLRVYALSPDEFRGMLEKNGIRVDRMIGKVLTMPLVLPWEKTRSEDYSKEFLMKLLTIEFELINSSDTTSLGGHFQAIGHKQCL